MAGERVSCFLLCGPTWLSARRLPPSQQRPFPALVFVVVLRAKAAAGARVSPRLASHTRLSESQTKTEKQPNGQSCRLFALLGLNPCLGPKTLVLSHSPPLTLTLLTSDLSVFKWIYSETVPAHNSRSSLSWFTALLHTVRAH